jgi:hypothetical protein
MMALLELMELSWSSNRRLHAPQRGDACSMIKRNRHPRATAFLVKMTRCTDLASRDGKAHLR